ncbi:hypothetical protein G3I44_04140 [Halogeometricum borinquense]|uniref:Uncharacterized protein n=1 Tax=Halogeometricum borinquense TaxID=60847 RepID=A0A6C0UG48_9EURY|nr:hypothetical protein [Halogeometricum borinquense]QIB73543.1 hypothetical protein G3I44_04140 [Halogeometricum borinquense]
MVMGSGGAVDGSTSSDSSISWGDISGAPDWIENPASFIKSTVGSWIASRLAKGFIAAASGILWAIYQPLLIFENTFTTIEDAVLDATGPAGDAIITAITDLNQAAADAVVGGGVVAPLLVWIIWVVEAALIVWTLVQIATILDPR